MKREFELSLIEMCAVKGGFDLEDYAGTYGDSPPPPPPPPPTPNQDNQ